MKSGVHCLQILKVLSIISTGFRCWEWTTTRKISIIRINIRSIRIRKYIVLSSYYVLYNTDDNNNNSLPTQSRNVVTFHESEFRQRHGHGELPRSVFDFKRDSQFTYEIIEVIAIRVRSVPVRGAGIFPIEIQTVKAVPFEKLYTGESPNCLIYICMYTT